MAGNQSPCGNCPHRRGRELRYHPQGSSSEVSNISVWPLARKPLIKGAAKLVPLQIAVSLV